MSATHYLAIVSAVLVTAERVASISLDPTNTKLDLPPHMLLANTSTDTGSALVVTNTFTGTHEYLAPDSVWRPSWSDIR